MILTTSLTVLASAILLLPGTLALPGYKNKEVKEHHHHIPGYGYPIPPGYPHTWPTGKPHHFPGHPTGYPTAYPTGVYPTGTPWKRDLLDTPSKELVKRDDEQSSFPVLETRAEVTEAESEMETFKLKFARYLHHKHHPEDGPMFPTKTWEHHGYPYPTGFPTAWSTGGYPSGVPVPTGW